MFNTEEKKTKAKAQAQKAAPTAPKRSENENILDALDYYKLDYWDIVLLGDLKEKGRARIINEAQDWLSAFQNAGLDVDEHKIHMVNLLLELAKTAPETPEEDLIG
tara:strand:- start:21238 stop:21555 length:318 start_codon:yes stop_codon:yes gene_type:complete